MLSRWTEGDSPAISSLYQRRCGADIALAVTALVHSFMYHQLSNISSSFRVSVRTWRLVGSVLYSWSWTRRRSMQSTFLMIIYVRRLKQWDHQFYRHKAAALLNRFIDTFLLAWVQIGRRHLTYWCLGVEKCMFISCRTNQSTVFLSRSHLFFLVSLFSACGSLSYCNSLLLSWFVLRHSISLTLRPARPQS